MSESIYKEEENGFVCYGAIIFGSAKKYGHYVVIVMPKQGFGVLDTVLTFGMFA